MQILLWLAPAAGVTVLAMLWVAWAGRPRPEQTRRSDAATAAFARAIVKEHPTSGRARPVVPRDRSTGIAVRPSSARTGTDGTRRSA